MNIVNTDRAFISLAIAEREAAIRNYEVALASGDVTEAERASLSRMIASLQDRNMQVRSRYGIGKVRAV